MPVLGVSPSFGFHCYRLIEGGLVEDEEFLTSGECLCEGFEVFIRVVFHRFTAGYLLVVRDIGTNETSKSDPYACVSRTAGHYGRVGVNRPL